MPRPFAIGTKCKTKKKPWRFCEIVAVDPESTRKQVWVVKFPDDGSTENGVRSQQLLRLAETDIYPTETPTASPTASVSSEPPMEDTIAAISLDEDVGLNEAPIPEVEPDDAYDIEDFDVVIDEESGEAVLFYNEQELEDVDVHKQKWASYKADKAARLASEWTVEVNGGKAKFEVGCRVVTKADPDHYGWIVSKTLDGRKWMVDFDNGETEMLAYQSMKLVGSEATPPYVWRLIDKSQPEEPVMEYHNCGLIDFDFEEVSGVQVELSNNEYDFPYMKLLQKLYPGDWRQQLRQLNKWIESNNVKRAARKQRKYNLVSQSEWWIFHGILIAAGPEGAGGTHMFETARSYRTATVPTDYGLRGRGCMAQYRFKEIKEAFPHAFDDHEAAAAGDPLRIVLLTSASAQVDNQQ